jgi:AcrR family transcriptional regulator
MSTTPRRRLKPETRRNEIIEAAERLLRDRGPAVRVDDVVREAGAAKGTFYLYFPTWDDLLEVVRARVFEAFDAAHPAPGSSKVDADWKKDLEDYAEAFIDAAVAMGGIHDVIFHSGFAQRRPATGVVDTIGRLAAVLAAGRVAGAYAAVDTAPIARMLFAVIHETLDMVAAGGDRERALSGMRFVLRRTLAPEPRAGSGRRDSR